jgi:predicted ATPase
MLTRVHIRNFRSCADVEIGNIGSTLALVGRNGAGKSNILQAIVQTAQNALSNEITFPPLTDGRLNSTVELEFKLQADVYRYSLMLSAATRPSPVPPLVQEELSTLRQGGSWAASVTRKGNGVTLVDTGKTVPIGASSPALSAIATLLPETEGIVKKIRAVLKFLSAIRYYPLDEPVTYPHDTEIVSNQNYQKWVANYESNGVTSNSVAMRLIYMFQKDTGKFQSLKSLLGNDGLDLIDKIEVDRVPVPGSADLYLLRFSSSRGQGAPQLLLPYDALSLGTRRIVRILVSMLFDGSSVMLLEQPEDSLHHGLTKKLLGLLQQNAESSQLIFSSHSSALLNQLRPNDVRLVSMNEGKTIVRALSPQEMTAAEAFLREEGTLKEFVDTVEET